MTRNRFFALLILTLTIFCFGININYTACANKSILEMQESLSQEIDTTLDNIDFNDLQQIIDNFNLNQEKMFSLSNIKQKVKQVISGENNIDYSTLLGTIAGVAFNLIAGHLPLIAIIVTVGILSSILGSIKSKFNEKSVGDIIHFVCFCVCVIVVVTIIKSLVSNTTNSITNMTDQMSALFPVLLTIMTAIGSTASVGVFQPALAIFSNFSSLIFSSIIIPIFMMSFCFSIVGNLSNNVKLDKFNSFLSSLFKWLVGIFFTIFFSIISIQGISAGSFDSVKIRTMKFTMSSYIPILGGYLSQGMDLILASSVLVKNAVGFVGILILISSIFAPILEIVIVSLLLKIASAILQPLNNDRITNFLHSTSKCIIMLSSCLIVVAFMYFLLIGICMATANVV